MVDIKPPFTEETAHQKVKAAQNMWNTQDRSKVVNAYTPNCIWRKGTNFFSGSEAIIAFLTAKWKKEKSYRLRKELFAFREDRNAVRFWYEFQNANDEMKWKRCYGLEDWTFDRKSGKMCKRKMSGNDMFIGPDGNGRGRWFLDGVDVHEVAINQEH